MIPFHCIPPVVPSEVAGRCLPLDAKLHSAPKHTRTYAYVPADWRSYPSIPRCGCLCGCFSLSECLEWGFWQELPTDPISLCGFKVDEATASRAVYAPGATNLTYVSVNTFYDLSRTVSAFANVTANFLPNEATRSPIVSKSETVIAIMGLAYRF
jgi:hypothetical protein